MGALDLEHDPKSGTLFVSVNDLDPRVPNQVLAFAANGMLQYSVSVGSRPGPLATSEDGSKLYVALAGAARIVTLDLTSHAVTSFQSLAPQVGGSGNGVYPAPNDLEVVPGLADTLAVSALQLGTTSPLNPLLVHARSVESLKGTSAAIADSVRALLPIDAQVTWAAGAFLTKVTRQSNGTVTSAFDLNVTDVINQLVPVGKDRLATDSGALLDAQSGSLIGRLATHGGVVASDDGTKVYVASTNGSTFTLTCYDARTAKQTGSTSLALPQGYTWSGDTQHVELELLGARGLAMRSLGLYGLGSLVLYPGILDSVTGC
ncbi:MAG: hypothetical protein JWN04_653 [Myxococcaceae bacterium]|nr:hypothetical protein [Myxococcaceae bacterium]